MILATDEDTKVKDAVALRFKELCEERNISPNALAVRSGVTPSTVYRLQYARFLSTERHRSNRQKIV